MNTTYEYSKPRRAFGQEPLFSIVQAHMLDSIRPNEADQKNYILRNPVHRPVQATASYSEHHVNTKQKITHVQGVNHSEGGWPRDVHVENEELVSRYIRRATHEDHYVTAVRNLAPAMQHCLDQNNAVDMYRTYFSDFPPQKPVETYDIRIANSFRDDYHLQVSSLTWTNESNAKIVSAYYNFSHKNNPRASRVLIWDIENSNEPIFKLQPECACWRLACHTEDNDIVACGLENGTVCIFDLRVASGPVSTSSIYTSHRLPITGIFFTHNRTNTELYTGAPDGQCLWWDMRDLSEPTVSLPICINEENSQQQPSLDKAQGISCLQFEGGFPTKFMCGTENGYVVNGNRLGKSYNEILHSHIVAHDGPVRIIERSRCTSRMFLTCGDWNVRVWSEEVRTAPIIVTKPYKHEVTGAAWSPKRYSCYMSVCEGGVFYYWDFLRKYREPVVTLKVSPHSLTTVAPHTDGELVAVGDDNGSIFLLQLSENMFFADKWNKHLMNQVYERETRREHILDNRVKEINLKRKTEEQQQELEEEIVEDEEVEKETGNEYFRIIKEELRQLYGTSGMSDISLTDSN